MAASIPRALSRPATGVTSAGTIGSKGLFTKVATPKQNHTHHMKDDDDIPVLVCHHCQGRTARTGTTGCSHCGNTGKMFWVCGYAFPYTPKGEQLAKEAKRRLR
jgi:hypothetical protein